MARHLLFLVVLLGALLSGCGDDAGSTAAGEPDATGSTESSADTTQTPEGPACEELWSDGENLPRSYRGCVEGSTWVAADTRRCESGQVLVVYADRYYGAKGAVVNDMGGPLEESKQYQQALRSCG